MDKQFYRLDRNGGHDKIAKASYSPKACRRENAKPVRPSTWKRVMVWILILGIIFGAAYLVDNRRSSKPGRSINTIAIWLNK